MTSGSSRRSRSTPGSRSRTPGSTSRSGGSRSWTSGSGSATTSTTGSSRTCTRWASRSRTCPELAHDDPDEAERRVERAIDSLHLTIRDIRNFIFGLRPELLGGTTLADGLGAIVSEFRYNSMIDVEVHAGRIVPEPDVTTTAHLLGVVNEALSNVARHSGATMATVSADTDEAGVLIVSVEDNGQGLRRRRVRAPSATRAWRTCAPGRPPSVRP